MDNIKFRAWDIKNQKWINLKENTRYFICPEGGYLFDIKWGNVVECVLQQYTGLKDKNGVEIYVGDLYKFGYSFDKDLQIYFYNGSFCGGLSLELSTPLNWDADSDDIKVDNFSSEIEVINNIFNTPMETNDDE